jgi:hypothetical protein
MKGTQRFGGCLRSLRPAAPCPRCGTIRVLCHVPLAHKGVACSNCCPSCTNWKPPVAPVPVGTAQGKAEV